MSSIWLLQAVAVVVRHQLVVHHLVVVVQEVCSQAHYQ
jgi:hypothetical protein